MNTKASRFAFRVALVAVAALGMGGCGAPGATLDLITVARRGLALADQAEAGQHAELLGRLDAQVAALDAAFDADVRLVGAGQLATADGQPVALTPEWVISARKGYAAARGLLAEDRRSAEAAHATRLDNLKAADEALDLAAQLIARQWAVSEQVRQQLIEVHRRLSNGQ